MRRAPACLTISAFLPWVTAFAPALPEGEPEATAPAEAEAAPEEAPAPEAEPAEVDAELELEGSLETEATDSETTLGIDADLDAEGDEADGDARAEGSDRKDPGLTGEGRREPAGLANQGGVGLFNTALPDTGGKMTLRFRVYTDFFRKNDMLVRGDQHARVRGAVSLGFSPFEWGELFFTVRSAANRNSRDQPGRQDHEATFALGDLEFGLKAAHRFKKYGIGIGGQVGVGLLAGSDRLRTKTANFWFDGLFSVDVRYLTARQFPFRFTTNIGWFLDNSLLTVDWARIADDHSAEVIRFVTGGNHNRLRMRYAIDFPTRFGSKRQFGIDPILEWSWDVATTEEPRFAQPDLQPARLPRSTQWLTIGVRANVIAGLHLDAAADVGLSSPSWEFGPPLPTWQVMLGLGYSFDPRPIVREVEVAGDQPPPPPPPEPVAEGRIVGQVIDPQGNPIPDARISFPGMTVSTILTDTSGSFTSYRFPAGSIEVQVVLEGQVVAETSAEVVHGQDTDITIQLETMPAAPTGIVRATFTDDTGKPLKVSLHVLGQGVNEPFLASELGQVNLELNVGDYRGTASAPGYLDKSFTFTVVKQGEIVINESLQLDRAPETPLVNANKRQIRLKRPIGYAGEDITESSKEVLGQLASFLRYHPEYAAIQINVHTDDRGTPQARSQARADAVKSYLVSQGVAPDRIEAKGYGNNRPVAVNLTTEGRSKNNRTIITVTRFNE